MIDKKRITDIEFKQYYDYLWDLGSTMLVYYRCTGLLTKEQAELIADSSDEDKIKAMEYVILNENNYKNLKNIYIRNTASINRVKRRKGKI